MKLAVISFTRRGENVCEKLMGAMNVAGVECRGYTGKKNRKYEFGVTDRLRFAL